MVSLLAKLFIKDSANLEDAGVRRKYGMLCGIAGICLNVVLFIIKYLAGVLSGAISITADAFNNLSDAGSSVISLLGFKFAGAAADDDHPFGHGRIEYISGLAVAMLILLMAFELGKSSIEKIISPEPVEGSVLTVVILVFSICVKLYMYFYNRSIGKKIRSASMSATAMDSLSDTAATAVVLISLLVSHFFKVQIDGWCGIAVALFILYSGINAAKDTISPLLGQPPEPEFVESIERIVMSHPEICGMHDLVVHDYGPGRVMVSLHGEVPGNGDIFALHDVIDCIEMELQAELGCEACIHMDPIDTEDENVAFLRSRVSEIVRSIDDRFTIHDFRTVHGETHTNLIFDLVAPHSFKTPEKELKNEVSRLVREEFPNHICVIKVDRSYV